MDQQEQRDLRLARKLVALGVTAEEVVELGGLAGMALELAEQRIPEEFGTPDMLAAEAAMILREEDGIEAVIRRRRPGTRR